MSRAPVPIDTPDGVCPASLFLPAETGGPWPGVLFFMDGLGIRPALFEMGERLAGLGYAVLLPDLFYRVGPYTAPHFSIFSDPEKRAHWMSTYMSSASPANVRTDTAACLDFLAAHPQVSGRAVGTTGYCMGGACSLRAAGNFPDRVAAAASYHGGNLATDKPDSPHLLAPRMKAVVYVAGAIEDSSFPDDMKRRLDDALTEAGVEHTVETYQARHGWVPTDTPVHDPAAAERHWQTLRDLFDRTLRGRG